MRAHPLLRWIEQAEARRAEQMLHERSLMARPVYKYGAETLARPRRPRLLEPLWRRLRPSRVANDVC